MTVSYMIAAPELMTTAATDLARIGSDLSAAHQAASTPTTALVPAAADEVSAGITRLFSQYANDFHELAGQASVFHGQFVGNLKASAASYASTENTLGSFLGGNNIWTQLDNALLPIQGTPLGTIVNDLVSILVLGGFFVGFFGFFLVLVPIGILLQWLNGFLPVQAFIYQLRAFLQQLGSLLP